MYNIFNSESNVTSLMLTDLGYGLLCRCSEVLAAEAVSCLNKALCHLKDIWEEIGIPEDQRLQRTNVVKNHIKVRGTEFQSKLKSWGCKTVSVQ